MLDEDLVLFTDMQMSTLEVVLPVSREDFCLS